MPAAIQMSSFMISTTHQHDGSERDTVNFVSDLVAAATEFLATDTHERLSDDGPIGDYRDVMRRIATLADALLVELDELERELQRHDEVRDRDHAAYVRGARLLGSELL